MFRVRGVGFRGVRGCEKQIMSRHKVNIFSVKFTDVSLEI